MKKDPIGELYRTDWSVERKPTTHPEHDEAIDQQSIDLHARKLEQEKLSRNVQRFLDLRERPLSLPETLAAVAIAFFVMMLLALVGISLGR